MSNTLNLIIWLPKTSLIQGTCPPSIKCTPPARPPIMLIGRCNLKPEIFSKMVTRRWNMTLALSPILKTNQQIIHKLCYQMFFGLTIYSKFRNTFYVIDTSSYYAMPVNFPVRFSCPTTATDVLCHFLRLFVFLQLISTNQIKKKMYPTRKLSFCLDSRIPQVHPPSCQAGRQRNLPTAPQGALPALPRQAQQRSRPPTAPPGGPNLKKRATVDDPEFGGQHPSARGILYSRGG